MDDLDTLFDDEQPMENTLRLPTGIEKLTEGQMQAWREIEATLNEGWPHHLITGPAGTGKTTLLQCLALNYPNVVMAAPTHKAVGVMRKKIPQASSFYTVHKLLEMRPANPKSTELEFQQVKKNNDAVDIYSIVIVDECSMIPRNLMALLKVFNVRCVIFAGDEEQLPPIGEEDMLSESFQIRPMSALTEIMRQAQGNPLIQALTKLRGHKIDWDWKNENKAEGKGVYHATPSFLAGKWGVIFKDEIFRNDPDSARYLCFTNRRVAEINQAVRLALLGDVARKQPFFAGERILLRSPLFVFETVENKLQKRTMLDTNTEGNILEVGSATIEGVDTWAITMQTDEGEIHVVQVAVNPGQKRSMLQHIVEGSTDYGRFRRYHDAKDRFVDAQSPYAITTHTAQGSTFGTVILDLADMRKADAFTLRRLLYTALGRAARMAIVVQ